MRPLLPLLIALAACSEHPGPGDGSSDVDMAATDLAPPVTGSALCQGGAPPPSQSCTEVTQYGITWKFVSAYPCGQFINGDWWVTPGSSGAVHITAITPDAASGKNGFMVNPTANDTQAFDSGADGYDASLLPTLPLNATPGSSIIKALSLAACDKSCLSDAAVLTVLKDPPPASAYRPAYFGDAASKRLYCKDGLNRDALPSLSRSPSSPPSLATVLAAVQRLQINYFGEYTGELIRPVNNVQTDNPYGPGISNNYSDAALRVLLHAAGDSDSERLQLTHALIQVGIDNDAVLRSGKSLWPANGGHNLGMKLPIAFAALVLNDRDIADRLRSAPRDTFAESGQVHLNRKGVVIWGQDVCRYLDATGETEYWNDIVGPPKSKTCLDPYLLIDGGEDPGGEYQGCCTSQALKGSALVVNLIPSLAPIWNDDVQLRYADRWVKSGVYTQPDWCAPLAQGGGADPANPGHCIPDPDLEHCATYPDCPCQAGKQCGRFPEKHATLADSGYWRSDFVDAMWPLYRP